MALSKFSKALIDVIGDKMAEQGHNANSIAPLFGMSQPTLNRTMRKERAFGTEELDTIAKHFHTSVSALARQAEKQMKLEELKQFATLGLAAAGEYEPDSDEETDIMIQEP